METKLFETFLINIPFEDISGHWFSINGLSFELDLSAFYTLNCGGGVYMCFKWEPLWSSVT